MSRHAFLDLDGRSTDPASARLAAVTGKNDHSDDDDDTGRSASPFLLSPGKHRQEATLSKDERDAHDEEALLQEFLKNPKAALALAENYVNATTQQARAQRTPLTEIVPEPGFVIQTKTTKSSQRPLSASSQSKAILSKDTTFFINVCYSDKMPAPTKATEKEIQKAINAEEGATYQVPFTISEPREYRDELARTYVVVDACIHPDPFRRAMGDLDYKLYIMELSMEWVEEKCGVDLSREFSLPHMKSKDELQKRPVLLPKGPAIQELSTSDTSIRQDTRAREKISQQQSLLPDQSTKNDVYVPAKNKTDIVPKSRLLPAMDGTLGIIVEIELPNHASAKDITIDIVLPDQLVMHSKSQGTEIDGGREYHVEVDLPNEPVDLAALRAEFHKKRRILHVYTLKKRRG